MPKQPTEFAAPLRRHDHVFLKEHGIMVQAQSAWFPIFDRHQRKFVPSIGAAKAREARSPYLRRPAAR